MYAEFFGLKLLPFNNTPDPRFFYNTPDHEEALASLLYAAHGRKGCVLVTGEIGSGKTLLSRMLVGRLPGGSKVAVITNSRLSGPELLKAIAREFGLSVDSAASISELIQEIEKFLLDQYANDRAAVVIVDEAQHLGLDAFEDVRLLGNLEADDAKLLQFLILGQPELQETFRKPELRQLSQRIFRSFHLRGLSREQTEGYIAHRLSVAGAKPNDGIFDADAVALIHEHSGGIPRVINQISDNAMLAAYSESSRRVTRAMVEETIASDGGMPTVESGFTAVTREVHREPSERPFGNPGSEISEIRRLVTTAREQAASMIAGLRRQVQQHVETAQTEIRQSLEQTRASVMQLRREADEASVPVERTRKYIASSVQDGLADLARFSGEVGTLHLEVRQHLGTARAELAEMMNRQKQEFEQFAAERVQKEKVSIRMLREEVKEEIERFKGELRTLMELPSENANQLRAAQNALHSQSLKQRTWVRDEIARAQKALTDRIEAGCKAVEDAKHLAEHAIGQAALAHHIPEDLPDKLRDRLAKILAAAKERLTQIRDDAAGTTKQMSLELTSLRNQARESLANAAFAGGELRRQHEAALKESRETVSGILERVHQAKTEMTQLLEQVRAETARAVEEAHRSTAEFGSEARDKLRTEADAQHKRLSSLWVEVERAATRVQNGSETLHEQVQTTSTALLQNVRQVLEEAKATAEKLTGRAEKLLAESTEAGQGIQQQCKALYDGSLEENSRIHDELVQMRQEMGEAYAQAKTTLQAADAEHQAAVEKTEAMLKAADQARSRAEEMLALPHQVLHETSRRTAALTELMQKITTILQALTTMGERARIQECSLQSAANTAEEQIHSLKHHSQRVGQLVGIIRQLYGTLDAKVGRLRDRLTVADDLFRVMPRQIDMLRQVLAEGASSAIPIAPAEDRPASVKRSPVPAQQAARPPARKVIHKPAVSQKTGTSTGQGSIAELARRNQKLNAWLRDVLEEAQKGEVPTEPASATRMSNVGKAAKPAVAAT